MSTILTMAARLREQADSWEASAKVMKRFDPADPKARVLELCAGELREIAEEARPEWVPLETVLEWSHWSAQTLRKRCREEWETAGEAKKDGSGRWQIAWSRALCVPRRKEPPEGRMSPEAYVDDLWQRKGA